MKIAYFFSKSCSWKVPINWNYLGFKIAVLRGKMMALPAGGNGRRKLIILASCLATVSIYLMLQITENFAVARRISNPDEEYVRALEQRIIALRKTCEKDPEPQEIPASPVCEPIKNVAFAKTHKV